MMTPVSIHNSSYYVRCLDISPRILTLAKAGKIEASHTPQFKDFDGHENNFALDYLVSQKQYKSLLCPPGLDWYPTWNNSETQALKSSDWYLHCKPIVQQFLEASLSSSHKSLSHPEYIDMIQTLVDEVQKLSKDEIMKILYHMSFFSLTASVKEPTYFSLWKALDNEICARYSGWENPFWFGIDYLMFRLKLNRLTSFHWTFINRLFRHCDKLTKEQFVWLMFCLNLVRRIPPNFSIYDLEHKLLSFASNMTAEEISIVAMGFFKTQTRIRDLHLYKTLVNNVIQHASTLHSVGVSAFAKFVRHSSSHANVESTLRFQEAFFPQIDRLTLTAGTHIILSGTLNQIPFRDGIAKVMDRVEKEIENVRLKELERVALTGTMFNMGSNSFYEKLVQELRLSGRKEELHQYGRSLPALLYYLTIKEIFPQDLIGKVLSKEFIVQYYGK